MTGIIERLPLEDIGARIKHIRESRKISMADMGMALGRDTRDAANSFVKHIEAGTRKSMDDTQLAKIMAFLGVTEAEFMGTVVTSGESNPLYELIPDLVDHVDALRIAVKIGNQDMVKSALRGIRDRIDRELSL